MSKLLNCSRQTKKKVVSLTTFFTFLQDLKGQPYLQTMFTFREMLTSLAPFFTAAVVIVQSPIVKEHIPSAVSNYLVSMYEKWLSRFSTPQVTVVSEEKGNLKISNQIYEAARDHLRDKNSETSKLSSEDYHRLNQQRNTNHRERK